MNSHKKLLASIATIAMLAGVLAGGALPARAGATSAGALSVTTFSPIVTGVTTMGTIEISGIPNLGTGIVYSFYLALPASNGYAFTTAMSVTAPGGGAGADYNNGVAGVDVTNTQTESVATNGSSCIVYNGVVQINVTMNASGNSGTVYITTPVFYNSLPAPGAVDVTVWGFGNASLPMTTVQIGEVVSSGNGVATVTAASTPTIGQDATGAIGTIEIQENVAGAIGNSSSHDVTLTLPAGYEWNTAGAGVPVAQGWSSPLGTVILGGGGTDQLTITPGTSSSAGLLWISGLAVQVPSNGALGSLAVTLGGAAGGTLEIATVGNYAATVTCASNPPDVFADLGGSTTSVPSNSSQPIADIYITESLAGSLVGGRSITLTLPAGVGWDPTAASGTSQLSNVTMSLTAGSWNGWNDVLTQADLSESDNVLTIPTPNSESSSAVTIDLKAHVYTGNSNYTGPLTVTVGGSAGVSGTVVAGTVEAPLTVTSSGVPTIMMGVQDQDVGDVTITENGKGNAGASSSYLDLWAPLGVLFVGSPSASVASGDLQIGSASITTAPDGQSLIQIPVTESSNTASTVKITAIKVSLNNGLAMGNLNLTVGDSFTSNAASVAVASVVGGNSGSNAAVFTMGATVYSTGGVQHVMDVAPYVSGGRAFVPVRYLAYALGVPSSGVSWDAATGTVSITLGSTRETLTVGRTTMTVNGAAQTMDVAPVIYGGRTMLPARWVAQGFGYKVGWNPVTQEVVVTM